MKKPADRGFTLIEVLVALVVAVAAMAIVAQGFTSGARASSVSQYATRAALLAQQILTDHETGELQLSQSYRKRFPNDPDFSYETAVESDVTGLSHLTVTVTWEERGQPRAYALHRLMRERPTEQTP